MWDPPPPFLFAELCAFGHFFNGNQMKKLRSGLDALADVIGTRCQSKRGLRATTRQVCVCCSSVGLASVH